LTGAVAVNAGTLTMGSGVGLLSSTLDVPGGTFTGGSGPCTITGAATATASGIINGGSSSNLTFAALTLGTGGGSPGTFNANSATVNVAGVFTLLDTSTFNGNTGVTTFSNAANALTAGTFNIGDTSTVGSVRFTQSTTFTSGVTVAFPSDAGELAMSPGTTLSFAGTVTSAFSISGTTLPKVDCNGCTATQGVTMGFATGSTINIDGLQFDHADTAGVSFPSTATYTLLRHLKFTNNAGNSTAGIHMVLTLLGATRTMNVPGCYFDTTATNNVALYGDSMNVGAAVAIFENKDVATNGPGAGAARDLSGDTDHNGFGTQPGDIVGTPYYGSVIQWQGAHPTDIAGQSVGFPTAAFDWNTGTFYGVYVAYKDAFGTNDRLYLRGLDGSADYSYDITQAYGDLVGTPKWDTVSESALNLDVDGYSGIENPGWKHVVYLASSSVAAGGHITRLIDTGSALNLPGPGSPWQTPFASGSVSTITSPLLSDFTNLYFSGTDGANSQAFAVQITRDNGITNDQQLVREVGPIYAVSAAPAAKVYSGTTYLFFGSAAPASQAYIYRIDMGAGMINASYSDTAPATTFKINDSLRIAKNHLYGVDDGGYVYKLDASTGTGSFTAMSGFPYRTAAQSPIQHAPFVDSTAEVIYFGDNAGNLHALNSDGTPYSGFPYVVDASIQLSSTPYYRLGVIAIGGSDGYLYLVDRNAGTGPAVFTRFYVGAQAVSTVGWNSSKTEYMVSTLDGQLTFAPFQADPTPGVQ
jgi:hypothetical protein